MSLSKYESTLETTNLARIARIILGPCTDILRDILQNEIIPSDLSKSVQNWINNLNKRKNPLTKQQKNVIFPPPTNQYGGNYSDFDVSLLYLLLRNISKIPSHSKGWGETPNPGDRSVSANIDRIRIIRNKYYGHVSEISISESEFRAEWRNIRDIIVELETKCLGASTVYQDSVTKIKTASMDPEQEKEFINKLMVIDVLIDKVENLSEEVRKLHTAHVIPMHVKVQHEEKIIQKWKEEDEYFCEAHSFCAMLERVRNHPYVTFIGPPGSGKSATSQHIALKLQKEGYEVVPVREFSELMQFRDHQNPQVFVFNDVLGIVGLQQVKLDYLLDYEEDISEPSVQKTKLLMTCREALFNECFTSFFTNEQNVIKMLSLENSFDDEDKKDILQKYGLDRNLLSTSLLKNTSSMFPLLCKLYSKEQKYRLNGTSFFINPVPCIIDDFNKMQIQNKLYYATLALVALNDNKVSEEILKNDSNKPFKDMKAKILENCCLESSTDAFKFVNVLLAMKGTYTKLCDSEYSFIHDSMFEIFAHQFGSQFPTLILEFMSSTYIANFVKLQKFNNENEYGNKNVNLTDLSKGERNDNGTLFDLCITLSEKHYSIFAERLYNDIENMNLYEVFTNEALKHPQGCQAFMTVLKGKTYKEMKSLFLLTKEDISKPVSKATTLGTERQKLKAEVEKRKRQGGLVDERYISHKLAYNKRVISWVIYYGHHRVLEYIVNRTEQYGNSQSELFENLYEGPSPQSNKVEIIYSRVPHQKERKNPFNEQPTCTPSKIKRCNVDSTLAMEEKIRLLVLSCYSGDLKTFRILQKYVNKSLINKTLECQRYWREDTPLTAACKVGQLNIVKELLNLGAIVNLKGHEYTPLTAACMGGHLSVVKELLNAQADVHLPSIFFTPLTAACRGGHLLVVKELIKAGADVHLSDKEHSPLTAACFGGDLNVVKEIIKMGADINLPGVFYTPLIAASLRGNGAVVEELLNVKAEVDLKHDGYTPLTAACERGHADIVEKLIKGGAQVNLLDNYRTPLTTACLGGYLNVVKALIKNGVNINQPDSEYTPLTAACKGGYIDVVRELLNAEAAINLQDPEGDKPLYIAATDVQLACFSKLIEYGADCTETNKKGLSPLHILLFKNKINSIWPLLRAVDIHQLTGIKLHMFNILVDIRHGDVKMDSKDEVIVAKRQVLCMKEPGDLWETIIQGNCDTLRHMIHLGLDVNQPMQLFDEVSEQPDVKPFLYTLIDGGLFVITKKVEKVKFLLQNGADVNIRIVYSDYDSMLDREGVSVLERTRRLVCGYSNSKCRGYGMKAEYKKVMCEIRRHVRRYSI